MRREICVHLVKDVLKWRESLSRLGPISFAADAVMSDIIAVVAGFLAAFSLRLAIFRQVICGT